MPKALIVLTSYAKLGDTGRETGFHYEEFTTPFYALQDAGVTVDLASVQGGQPPYDPGSLPDDEGKRAESVTRFLNDSRAKRQLSQTIALREVNSQQYDLLYLPGGHGTMWDLPESSALVDIISEMHAAGKFLCAVCHGPAGFVNARSEKDSEPVVKGVKISCFTDEEERQIELDGTVPFLLESKLKEQGAEIVKTGPFKSCAVRDGQFITGQNPASLASLSAKMTEALKESGSLAA